MCSGGGPISSQLRHASLQHKIARENLHLKNHDLSSLGRLDLSSLGRLDLSSLGVLISGLLGILISGLLGILILLLEHEDSGVSASPSPLPNFLWCSAVDP